MLLHGPSVPTTIVSVEPQAVSAPVTSMASFMTAETERILIEEHAAPHWGLSIEQAWDYYHDGVLKIQEMTLDYRYKITYDGGLIEVVLEGSGL